MPPMPQFGPPPAFPSGGPPTLGARDAYGPVYGAVQSPSAGPAKSEDPDEASLNLARQAYWAGDLERAKQEYSALIRRLPDNPDLYGELGNLRYAQGDWEGAADSYYEAGTRLVKQGRTAQAVHLLSVVRGLSKDKAESFEAFLKGQGRGDLLR
jgi:TolA-binding protein